MNAETWKKCLENRRSDDLTASVRFMVMENGGKSLQRIMIHKAKLSDQINVGIELIRAISIFHENGFIHGDIHTGNIIVSPTPAGELNLRVIDFGRSFPIRPNRSNKPVNKEGFWRSIQCTHWQMMGLQWGMRDDLLKALYVLAEVSPIQWGAGIALS